MGGNKACTVLSEPSATGGVLDFLESRTRERMPLPVFAAVIGAAVLTVS